MPLPWTNKHRVTRISQFVNDLHSPKPGAPFVVQTAFPTSIIHLLINNKNHCKKPKSNKPLRRQVHDPPPSSHPPESTSSNDSTADFADCRQDETPSPSLTPALVTGNLDGNDGVSQVGKSDGGSVSKTVLAGFLKMLVVVVLIAIVENLTVGITVSAFMLVFLEYVAKRVVLCSNSNVEVPEPITIVGDAECRTDSLSFDETEVVETSMCSEENSRVDLKLDCVKGDKKWGCSEFDTQEGSNSNREDNVVNSCEVSLRGTKGSSRSEKKFKSKMKKLLPKKLKGSSRKEGKERKRGKEREAETSIEERSESFEVEEEENSGSRSPPLVKINLEYVTTDHEKEVDSGFNSCEECSVERVEEVIVNNSEEKKIGRVGNSSGCIILSVIALVGLVVGRFPALILIMTWCFVLKIVTKRGRSMSPLINSSVPNS